MQFDVYIHGVPVGHEICGTGHDNDYIKEFYSHNNREDVSSLLQIDILNNKAFYTYLRTKNVNNYEGRPGSYFGISVCFTNLYCTNVSDLYDLLEKIYKAKCLNEILKKDQYSEQYKVSEIGRTELLKDTKEIFSNNIKQFHFSQIQSTSNPSKVTKFNLEEIDSRTFIEATQKGRVLVSPEFESQSSAFAKISQEVKTIKEKNKQLISKNENLSDTKQRLEDEYKKLNQEIEKYKGNNSKQQQRYQSIEEENKRLKNEIEIISDEITTINALFQKLSKHQSSSKYNNYENESNGESKKKFIVPDRSSLIIFILLIFITILVSINTYQSYSTNSNLEKLSNKITSLQIVPNTQPSTQTVKDDDKGRDNGRSNDETKEDSTTEETPLYDDFEKCVININGKGKNEQLKKDKEYTLSITLNDYTTLANVPAGTWEINAPEGVDFDINQEKKTFIINTCPANVQQLNSISYIVDEETKLTRSKGLTIEQL